MRDLCLVLETKMRAPGGSQTPPPRGLGLLPHITAAHDLAELRAKIKIKKKSESGRNRPKTYDFLKKVAVRTLPRDPPGQGEN